uniref:Beta-defensin n=1 Tax=Canis lupus familiaris TaxID=9615 RepID=A0A8C0MBK9_CANLF
LCSFYYLININCYVTHILPKSKTLVDPAECTNSFGHRMVRCFQGEEFRQICYLHNKACCYDILYDEE